MRDILYVAFASLAYVALVCAAAAFIIYPVCPRHAAIACWIAVVAGLVALAFERRKR